MHPESREHVEDLRRDTVTARLVPREVCAVEQHHAGGGPCREHGEGGRRTGGPRTDHGDVGVVRLVAAHAPRMAAPFAPPPAG